MFVLLPITSEEMCIHFFISDKIIYFLLIDVVKPRNGAKRVVHFLLLELTFLMHMNLDVKTIITF